MTNKETPIGETDQGKIFDNRRLKGNHFSALSLLKKLALQNEWEKHPNYPKHLTIAVRKYTDKTSNGLTKCIIDFIKFNGGQAERISNTGRPIDRREVVTNVIGQQRQIGSIEWIPGTGANGTADISATIQGYSVKIEVKCKVTGDRYQSQDQKLYQQAIEAAGGLYIIAREFQQFYNWYGETFSKGERHE